ncbi:MAG: TolB protein [Solirubrobacteraceae bacterium]|nr:TolB protein [Solirubrobacteraceae bacterium]
MATRHRPQTYVPPSLVAPVAFALRSRSGPTARVGAMIRNSGIRLSSAVALALATLAAVAAPASAAFPGDNGLIAFTSDRDGNGDVYTMAGDGSAQTRLTNTGAHAAAWSPDGTQLAFSRVASISTMASDGSAQAALTNSDDHDPAWSPDGTRIAFARLQDGNFEIYTMARDAPALTRVTDNNAAYDIEPAWSPDGTRIAFSSVRDSSPRDGNYEIYTIAVDGSGLTRLTNNATRDNAPAWSPDGTKLAYSSFRDGNEEIYTIASDGSAQTRLTNNATDDYAPAWSPDGTRIAFTGRRDGNFEIYTMASDGSATTRLTNNVAFDGYPDWQPVAPRQVPPPAPLVSPSGSGTPPPRGAGAGARVPTASRFSSTRRDFCVGRNCPRSRRGTVLRFTLSAAARVEFAFERRLTGRRADGRCGRPTRHNRRGRRCSYYANAGSFSQPATAGTNSVAFTGRIAGRALRSGSYRLTLTPIGVGGARSTTQRIRFTVFPPPRARPDR